VCWINGFYDWRNFYDSKELDIYHEEEKLGKAMADLPPAIAAISPSIEESLVDDVLNFQKNTQCQMRENLPCCVNFVIRALPTDEECVQAFFCRRFADSSMYRSSTEWIWWNNKQIRNKVRLRYYTRTNSNELFIICIKSLWMFISRIMAETILTLVYYTVLTPLATKRNSSYLLLMLRTLTSKFLLQLRFHPYRWLVFVSIDKSVVPRNEKWFGWTWKRFHRILLRKIWKRWLNLIR
jgi:hypothetical protein